MALIDRIDSARKQISALARSPLRAIRVLSDSGWENILTGHGTARDKRTGARIRAVTPTNDYATLDSIYAGDDIAARIADKAPEDMIRKWITLTVSLPEKEGAQRGAEQMSATEIAEAVMTDLDRLDSKAHLKEALVWARVFGGALIFIAADDSDDLSQPLDPAKVKSVEYLEVFDRFEVDIAERYSDTKPEDLDHVDKLGEPKLYRIQTSQAERSQHDQQLIHETRFLRFDGVMTSRRRRVRNNGWSDSVYTRLETVLSDFGITWSGVAHLLSDFSQAVFKMKGLAEAVAGTEGNLVLERMQIMDTCRSTVRVVPIDAESEDLARQTTPVTGLPDLLDRFMYRLSAAARMPATILFGRSPAGMSATGESDLSIWYDQIGSMQETGLRPQMTVLIDLVMAAGEGPTRGKVPSWTMGFNPLWQASQEEETKTRKTQAEADAIYIEQQVLTPDEVAESRFGGEAYSYETQLDTEQREAEQIEPPPGEE